jgi:ABC-type proline/glycine betaine transport system permease subunit
MKKYSHILNGLLTAVAVLIISILILSLIGIIFYPGQRAHMLVYSLISLPYINTAEPYCDYPALVFCFSILIYLIIGILIGVLINKKNVKPKAKRIH